ncbi:hypothetical protein J7J81_01135 [bacterium]|nr:hypothetical protein [bacterium]
MLINPIKKNKKIIFLFLIAIFFAIFTTNFVFAQGLEVHYPSIPSEKGEITITATSTAPQYIKYIFNFSLIIGAIIAFGALVYAGFIFLTSTGKPALLNEAKDRIFSAVLGLAILLGSFVILNTVNPRLTVLKVRKVKLPYQGILLKDTASGKEKVFFTSVSDFGDFEPSEYKFLSPRDKIEVTLYSGLNFSGTSTNLIYYNGDTLKLLSDVYRAGMDRAYSMKIKGIGPGVYLYKETDGNLIEFGPVTEPIPDLSFYDFSNPTKIRIKNGPGTNFLSILYNKKNFWGKDKGARVFFQRQRVPGGDCNPTSTCDGSFGSLVTSGCGYRGIGPYLNSGAASTSTCGNIATSTQMVDINKQDRYGELGGTSLSLGIAQLDTSSEATCTVTLYKKVNYEASTTANEKCEIHKFIFEPEAIDKEDICGDDWNDNVLSMEIKGRCLVLLFENRRDNCKLIRPYYCWSSYGSRAGPGITNAFVSDVPDLRAYPIKKEATSIAIYPYK